MEYNMIRLHRSLQISLRTIVALSLGASVAAPAASAQNLTATGAHRFERQESLIPISWSAENAPQLGSPESGSQQGTCDFSSIAAVVWWGTDRYMSLERFASYAAPVYWFSPDEPFLERNEGADIRIPGIIPGEPFVDKPVVYYQFDEILNRTDREGEAFIPGDGSLGSGQVDLENVGAVTLGMFAYFADEVGLGAHPHDLEATSFKMVVLRSDNERFQERGIQCDEPNYVIGITRTSAKAHGLVWFWNIVETDEYTSFPMHLLVEEGKHGIGTDKNGDGYFTPGYDVNVRINDAWGVRDNMATGLMATGKFEAWMAKVRRPEHRVFPPLPEDSPHRADLDRRIRGESHAVYELRPLPSYEIAGDDHGLEHIVAGHYVEDWPELGELDDLASFESFISEGTALKSLSIALRLDGDVGFSFVFPFFIVAHLNDPTTGGYIVHRMYFKDKNLQDFGWMALYTPSASRWVDGYFGAGAELDVERDSAGVKTKNEWDFVLETGLKFRVNMAHTPLKFLTFLTDYWGFRAGIKNRGFFDIKELTYVFEFGAGSF